MRDTDDQVPGRPAYPHPQPTGLAPLPRPRRLCRTEAGLRQQIKRARARLDDTRDERLRAHEAGQVARFKRALAEVLGRVPDRTARAA